jgi:O-acetyl-ADP-ribose deacetylase (regulator of RNase III)
MQKQGCPEQTGEAKITPAYNLPCKFVIHTVGPIVDGRLTEKHCELLASSYLSCLEAAVENGCGSIAFCCISTGVFGFPQERAAEIAVNEVRQFRKASEIEVIFNVFKLEDYEIYRSLLG